MEIFYSVKIGWIVFLFATVASAGPIDLAAREPLVVDVPELAAAAAQPWTEWELDGTFLESRQALINVLAPQLASRPVLTASGRAEVAAICAGIGYELLSATVAGSANRAAVLHLRVAPLPVVRSVDISVHRGLLSPSLGEAMRARVELRAGATLPYRPEARRRVLQAHASALVDFLRDEGFFDAKVTVREVRDGAYAIRIYFDVVQGAAYTIGAVRFVSAQNQDINARELKEFFNWPRFRLLLKFGKGRFRRESLGLALEAIEGLYRRRGFPSVQVSSNYSSAQSFDRNKKSVAFTVSIQERRQVEVVFTGSNRYSANTLLSKLTFNDARSADDIEAAASALSLAAFFQEAGYFDTQVYWTRERGTERDKLIFRIAEGPRRRLARVLFRGNTVFPARALEPLVTATETEGTKSLLTGVRGASTERLLSDAERIRLAYVSRGYLEATVRVAVAPDPSAQSSAALTAALLASQRGRGDLYVEFVIDEGLPSLIHNVVVEFDSDGVEALPEALCDEALNLLAGAFGAGGIRDANRCGFTGLQWPLQEGAAQAISTRLTELLREKGHYRSDTRLRVDRQTHRVVYQISVGRRLTIGQSLVRGNFRTRAALIAAQAGLLPGTLVTPKRLADAQTRLRAMALFSSVEINLLNGDIANSVDPLIRVTELTDPRFIGSVEGGYSTRSEWFVRGEAETPNISGVGIAANASVNLGQRYQALEGSGRLPRWLIPRRLVVAWDTEITGYWRVENTARYGDVETVGGSLSFVRTWERSKAPGLVPRRISASLSWDYRLRNREVAAVRPPGADLDLATVPAPTETGSLGARLRYDTRRDQGGSYNPLLPEKGIYLDGLATLAHPSFLGRETFVKLSLSGQAIRTFRGALRLRADARVDHGFPINGYLLPELERFFAGGDNTVRGYARDQVGREVITSESVPLGVPQIQILPAAGNVRALAGFDAQLRLSRVRNPWWSPALAAFVDAGLVETGWNNVRWDRVAVGVGTGLRFWTPFGVASAEWAVPLRVRVGDDPLGDYYIGIAIRSAL